MGIGLTLGRAESNSGGRGFGRAGFRITTVIVFSAFSGVQTIKSSRSKGGPHLAFWAEALTLSFVTSAVTIVTDAGAKDLCWVFGGRFALDSGLVLRALIPVGIIEAFSNSDAFWGGSSPTKDFSRETTTGSVRRIPCEGVIACAGTLVAVAIRSSGRTLPIVGAGLLGAASTSGKTITSVASLACTLVVGDGDVDVGIRANRIRMTASAISSA